MFDDLADDAFRIITDDTVGMGRSVAYAAEGGVTASFDGVYTAPSSELDVGVERGRVINLQPMLGVRAATFAGLARHPQQGAKVTIAGIGQFRIRAVHPREIGWIDLELEEV